MASKKTPRYVRVAQALALVTGLAGATGCGESHSTDAGATDTTTTDRTVSDSGPTDTGTVDTTIPPVDAGTDSPIMVDSGPIECFVDCSCFGEPAGLPECDTLDGGFTCCAAIGPLFPPNLPA